MIKVKDICYIIKNWNKVSKVEIIAIHGEFYTVRFIERPHLSAAKLRRSRLYLTEEKAKEVIDKKPKIEKEDKIKNICSPEAHFWPCCKNGIKLLGHKAT